MGLMLVGLVATLVMGADEIKVTAMLKVDNGNFALQRNVANQPYTQTNAASSYNIQNVGTSEQEQVSITSDVLTNGWTWLRNITTNANRYVDIGAQDVNTNFLAIMRIQAGEFGVFRLHPTNAVFARASGGEVKLEFWTLND